MARWKRRVSIAFGVYSGIVYAAFAVFLLANRAIVSESALNPAVTLAAALSFTIQALLLTQKRPENRIGWLLLLVALLQQTSFARTVAEVALARGAQPTAALLFWFNLWAPLSAGTYSLLGLVFVLFPDGRLLTARWRPVLWSWLAQLPVVAAILFYLSADFNGGAAALADGRSIALVPLEGVPLPDAILHTGQLPAVGVLATALMALSLVVFLAALGSQVTRFRQGNHLERQQIKWVVFAMALWVLLSVPFVFFPEARGILDFIFVPIVTSAVVVPILRYRLYDIDLIIRRTLVYGLLSGLLAAVYFGSVTLLQSGVAALSGQEAPAAIVLSTLLIAALFSPLRRQAQEFIDRRFYRAKYDANLTLARFAETARDEVEMEALTAELVQVIEETMRPETVAIWIRSAQRERALPGNSKVWP